jgi:hypothetical protein
MNDLDKDTIFNFIDQYFIEKQPLFGLDAYLKAFSKDYSDLVRFTHKLKEQLDNLKDEMDDISDNIDEVYNKFDDFEKPSFETQQEVEKTTATKLHHCSTTHDMEDLYEIRYGRTVFSAGNNTWYLYIKKNSELVYIGFCPFCGEKLE